ncbi:MAG TPA: hypothetical protein VFG04_19055 [Planctomycetaceae bacterium]|nr:hypothetical protein [Planctomycetaceae bacterium]
MPTARRGQALPDVPVQSCGHRTQQIAIDGVPGQAKVPRLVVRSPESIG